MSQKLREALEALVNAVSYKARFRDKDTSVGAALVLARTALSQPAEAVPGWKLVPVEADDAMLDRAVAFALNVTITQGYGWTEYMRDLYRTLLAAAPAPVAAPSEAVPGWKLVPVEPTEAEIDAPRDFLLGLELSLNKTEAMRKHLDMLGTDYSCLPDWFKNEDTHLTKAGKAICIRAFMLAAAQEVSK
jgi:hypothetical protein